jgi:hypothetical protein
MLADVPVIYCGNWILTKELGFKLHYWKSLLICRSSWKSFIMTCHYTTETCINVGSLEYLMDLFLILVTCSIGE